jgi:aldehyde dehydrogenase (NAD+)
MEYKTNINFRKEVLIKLLNAVIIHENEIIQALYDDFKKPAFVKCCINESREKCQG